MTLQHITLAEVKTACRQLHAERRLLAQSGIGLYGYQIIYQGVDYRCAIGSILTEETLKRIDAHAQDACTLMEFYPDGSRKELGDEPFYESFVTVDPTEYDALCELQGAHDRWLTNAPNDQHEAIFLRFIAEDGA